MPELNACRSCHFIFWSGYAHDFGTPEWRVQYYACEACGLSYKHETYAYYGASSKPNKEVFSVAQAHFTLLKGEHYWQARDKKERTDLRHFLPSYEYKPVEHPTVELRMITSKESNFRIEYLPTLPCVSCKTIKSIKSAWRLDTCLRCKQNQVEELFGYTT